MAEKRGGVEKLLFEFDTARCLEVEKKGKWYRVTANSFRSYGGNRRILNTENDNYTAFTGSTYYVGTNKIVPADKLQECVMFLDNTEQFFGRRRAHEAKWNIQN